METFEERLRTLAKLGDNWDGYGAAGISEKVVSAARDIGGIICKHVQTWGTFPTPAGTIEMEWFEGDFCYMIEVGETAASFFKLSTVIPLSRDKNMEHYGSISSMKTYVDQALSPATRPGIL